MERLRLFAEHTEEKDTRPADAKCNYTTAFPKCGTRNNSKKYGAPEPCFMELCSFVSSFLPEHYIFDLSNKYRNDAICLLKILKRAVAKQTYFQKILEDIFPDLVPTF